MKSEKSELIIITTLLLIFFTVMGLPKQYNNEKSCPDSVKPEIIVSPGWLTKHLNNESIIVLHISSTRAQYEMGHIPEARFFWPQLLIESSPEESAVPPAKDKIKEILENLGISNDSRIVLCGSAGNVGQVSRIFATLEYSGLRGKVSILNGGIEAWIATGGQLSRTTPKIMKSEFLPKINEDVFVSSDFIKSIHGKADHVIIDARGPKYFSGESGYPRKGHIPGAVNLSTTSLADLSGIFMDEEKMKEQFASASLKPGNDITVYCQIGQSASIVYAATRQLGYKVHIYDGSFEDWGSREDLPLEVSFKPVDQTINNDPSKEKK